MKPIFPPLEMLRLTFEWTRMAAEANRVIAMRLMGMAGTWNVTPSENARMVREKTEAAADVVAAAGLALALRGRVGAAGR